MDHDERHDRRESCDEDVCTSCGRCCGGHHEACRVVSDGGVKYRWIVGPTDADGTKILGEAVGVFEARIVATVTGATMHDIYLMASAPALQAYAARLRNRLDSSDAWEPMDDATIRQALSDAAITEPDAEAALGRLQARVSEFEKMREERNAAVHNECETAALLAGAREHIAKLQESIDHLSKQVVPDSLPTPTGRVLTIAREHANNCACGDLENCRACRMRDLFTLIPIGEDEEIAAYVETPEVRRKRREEIAALVERIRNGLAKVVKPRPVPICSACNGPLFLDAEERPVCQACGPRGEP